jgi:hypothetical protein
MSRRGGASRICEQFIGFCRSRVCRKSTIMTSISSTHAVVLSCFYKTRLFETNATELSNGKTVTNRRYSVVVCRPARKENSFLKVTSPLTLSMRSTRGARRIIRKIQKIVAHACLFCSSSGDLNHVSVTPTFSFGKICLLVCTFSLSRRPRTTTSTACRVSRLSSPHIAVATLLWLPSIRSRRYGI